jgi:hypothetical protein
MRSLAKEYVKKPIELMLPRPAARALWPDRLLAFEHLVRSEVALHRLLAASRRAASTRMSAVRRAKAAMIDCDAAEKMPPGFVAALPRESITGAAVPVGRNLQCRTRPKRRKSGKWRLGRAGSPALSREKRIGKD